MKYIRHFNVDLQNPRAVENYSALIHASSFCALAHSKYLADISHYYYD